jgi:hypothetical protein
MCLHIVRTKALKPCARLPVSGGNSSSLPTKLFPPQEQWPPSPVCGGCMASPRQSPPAQADGGANGGVQAGSRQGSGEAPQANAQYGTAVWERRRAEWLASQQSGVEPAVGRQGPVLGCVIAWSLMPFVLSSFSLLTPDACHSVCRYDDMADLLQSMQPFPRPVPLSVRLDPRARFTSVIHAALLVRRSWWTSWWTAGTRKACTRESALSVRSPLCTRLRSQPPVVSGSVTPTVG